MWNFPQGRTGKSNHPEIHHLCLKHQSIPCSSRAERILKTSPPQAVCLLQELCWVTHAWSGAQKHFQCHDPTSYPRASAPNHRDQLPTTCSRFVQHFAVLKPARQLPEIHFQRFIFSFLFPHDHVFHPSSSSPRYRPAMAHKMPEAAVLCHKNRCFFNCPSHRHNWLNEKTHKIGCSTRVKGGSFPQLLQEEKKNKISLFQPEKCSNFHGSTRIHFSGP